MKMITLTAASAALALSTAATAQSAQDRLDARYDRALAAGYKALFLCSGIANAERNGATRTPESIHDWELTGIQAPLDDIIRDLSYEVVRRPSGQVAHVQVDWAEDAPDRVAVNYGEETGCSILPIGAPENTSNPDQPVENTRSRPRQTPGPDAITMSPAKAPIEKPLRAADLAKPINNALTGEYGEGTRTTAIVVRQNGNLAGERYTEGFTARTPQRTWSVAKSIAATFVGAAVHSGEFEVSEPIALRYWVRGGATDLRSKITIDDALRMATGRYSDTPGNRTDPLYWGGSTVDETATDWPLIAEPGTVYRYANNDTLMAVKAIDSYLKYYSPADLLNTMGMEDTVAETDIRGNYVLSSQVWSTARDLAKLGELYLNNGMVDGEQVLPMDWRGYISDPSGPQPEGTPWGYGAGWWTFRRPDGNAFEGVPDDAFAARGNRGQYVVVVPSRNAVIVRRGEDIVGTRFDIAAFTKDVLAALD